MLFRSASDAGYVVLIPLGAVIFKSFGRHPLAGIAAAFAGVSGGFSANLLPGPTDALLGGITTEAAKLSNASYEVGMTGNWYFIIASALLITILGTIVTEMALSPKSNTAHIALDKALEDVATGRCGDVPDSIKIHSTTYKYPHDFPNNFVVQQYLPDNLISKKYYIPKDKIGRAHV